RRAVEQAAARAGKPERRSVLPRRHASGLLELSLQVVLAGTEAARQLVQRDRRAVRLDQLPSSGDPLRLWGPRLVRTAAFARPEAGLARGGCVDEVTCVLGAR